MDYQPYGRSERPYGSLEPKHDESNNHHSFFNGEKYIGKLLESIPSDLPIIVVDDQSETPFSLSSLPDSVNKGRVRVLRMTQKGYFTGAVNAGIRAAGDSDVLVLNQDTYFSFDRGWLELLEENREKYALIGERIMGNHPAWPNGYIHGTFMFARRDAINAVGLMDAKTYPLWGSTCEWQLRFCRAGFDVLPVRDIPGFVHERGNRSFGDSIDGLLKKEPHNRMLYLHTPPHDQRGYHRLQLRPFSDRRSE